MPGTRAVRLVPRPTVQLRPDPRCVTCHGTGVFVPKGKLHNTAVACPRCLGRASVHFLPPMPSLPYKDPPGWEW